MCTANHSAMSACSLECFTLRHCTSKCSRQPWTTHSTAEQRNEQLQSAQKTPVGTDALANPSGKPSLCCWFVVHSALVIGALPWVKGGAVCASCLACPRTRGDAHEKREGREFLGGLQIWSGCAFDVTNVRHWLSVIVGLKVPTWNTGLGGAHVLMAATVLWSCTQPYTALGGAAAAVLCRDPCERVCPNNPS